MASLEYGGTKGAGMQMVGMIFYRPKFFDIKELVDRETFNRWGEKAWMFLRPEALNSLDMIRDHFEKPVWVNNWEIGGDFQWRGLRPAYSTVGNVHSQHRFGNGFDLDVQGVNPDEVRETILKHQDNIFTLITCLETDITWVHFDCRNILDRIRLVKP